MDVRANAGEYSALVQAEQRQLQAAVAKAVAEFNEATGLQVASVDVHFTRFTNSHEDRSTYVLDGVAITIAP